MKLRLIETQLNKQAWSPDELSELRQFIEVNCAPYLAEIDSAYQKLYRGTAGTLGGNAAKVQPIRTDRQPTHSSPRITQWFNQVISEAGLVANRQNAMFCTGDKAIAGTYGTVSVVLPVGNFNYTWSKTAKDWFVTFESYLGSILDRIPELPVVAKSGEGGLDALDTLNSRIFNLARILGPNAAPGFPDVQMQHMIDSYGAFEQMTDDQIITWSRKTHADFLATAQTALQLSGDDGSLHAATVSKHEIMVAASHALYVDEAQYDMMFGIR